MAFSAKRLVESSSTSRISTFVSAGAFLVGRALRHHRTFLKTLTRRALLIRLLSGAKTSDSRCPRARKPDLMRLS